MLLTAPAICLYLAEISKTQALLFGEPKSESESQVIQLYELSNTSADDKILTIFNEILGDRTFLVGQHITFADLAVFARVYKLVLALSDAQKWELNHLFRWFNHIQHLAKIEEYLNRTSRALASYPKKIYTSIVAAQAAVSEENSKKKGKKGAANTIP